MKKTFVCNESMVITIPIGSLRDAGSGALMPEKFHCVFRDFYKVFVVRGKPKSAGAAQAMTGVFICILGLITSDWFIIAHTLPSVLFVVSGMVCYAAGTFPNMHVAKLSFSLNIISFFWSIAGFFFTVLSFYGHPWTPYSVVPPKILEGICGLIVSLLVVENLLAVFLIYWLSQAICRQQFNSLPIILLKQAD